MPRNVVLVGHCGPDSSYLRITVQKALPDVVVNMADDQGDLQKQIKAGVDLLLVNRTLDYGFTCEGGAELIRHLRIEHPNLRDAGEQLSGSAGRSGGGGGAAGIWETGTGHAEGGAATSRVGGGVMD